MNERREYFRIEQDLGACLTPLKIPDLTDPYDKRLNLPPTLSLINQIRELEQEASLTLKKIQARNGDIARYLKNLNQRTNLLELGVFNLDKSYPELIWQNADYSEAGISLTSPNAFEPNTLFHLIIALPDPEQRHAHAYHWLSIISNLINCETSAIASSAGTMYKLGLNFKYVNEIDQQYLARHILRVQSVRRRQALDSDEIDTEDAQGDS